MLREIVLFREKRPLYLAIFAAVVLWLMDSVIDFYFVYDKQFTDLLFLSPPPHEVWMRLVAAMILVGSGIFTSSLIDKLESVQEEADWERQFLLNVIDSLKHPFYVVDPSTHEVLKANEAALKSLPLNGQKCYEVTHGQSEPCQAPYHDCPVETAVNTRDSCTTHHLHFDKEGQTRLIEVRANPIEDLDGNVSAVAVNMVDITDVNRVKQALEISSDYSMFYMDLLTHDFRNKLQSCLLLTEMMEENTDNSQITKACEGTLDQLKEMSDMISKLSLTKSLGQSPIRETSLTGAIDWSIEQIQHEFDDVRIISDFEDREVTILADEHLKYLIYNLIENAAEHNPKPIKRIWITLKRKESGWELSIADDGPGIDDTRKVELLNPERRFGGVGVHQAQHIAKKYGASIEICNRVRGLPGKGSEFKVFFPFEPETANIFLSL
jgi:K+-sensing histidine kinase KdpD